MPVLCIPYHLARQALVLDAIAASEDAKMAPKRPDLVKKQERVKRKVAKKRDRKCIEAIVKAGGDDSHPDVVKFVAKKPKGGEKEVEFVTKPKQVSDKSAKPKSVRGGNTRKSNKDALVVVRCS